MGENSPQLSDEVLLMRANCVLEGVSAKRHGPLP